MPSETVAVTLECAGNSRIFLDPKAGGVQWELGAVGTAEWTGVPLKTILEKAGVRDSAVEVVLEGADRGEIKDPPKSPGEISFSRSLPVEKALTDNILLAYEMNGERLAPEHGFPVRAVVPGWYGMAWVKWLERIVVTEEPFTGFFQTADYSYWVKEDGLPPQMIPITEMQVKSEIARPAMHEIVAANSSYKIKGAAWSGDAKVSKVEISTDGGKKWHEAKLDGRGAGKRVADVGIRMGSSRQDGKIHADGAGDRRARARPAFGTRRRARRLSRQSHAARRDRS